MSSQKSFEKIVAGTIKEFSLFKPHDTVIVAVSGGIDSVLLLDYLASREDLSLKLVVAHLNHCLRGEESDEDEEFVRSAANRYKLPFESVRVDVRVKAARDRQSLEEAGREARYRFFDETAEKVGASSVALAHHMNDQAETVLMRLLRGSGSTGLGAMLPRSAEGRFVRPFLYVSREQIEENAKQRGLTFRFDSSNDDHSILRNKIRGSLIPILKQYNPAVVQRLADTASIMAGDEEILSKALDTSWQTQAICTENIVSFIRSSILEELPGLRYRLYRRALERVRGDLRRIAFCHLQAIDRLVFHGPPNGRLDLPDNSAVSRSYDRVLFSINENSTDEGYEIQIEGPGEYFIPGVGRVAVTINRDMLLSAVADNSIVVNQKSVPFPWIVRPFKPGDRISQAGMSGRKKVKDLFIDEKIPRSYRSRIPLFFSGDILFWVPGLRTAFSALPKQGEEEQVCIEFLEFERLTDMLG